MKRSIAFLLTGLFFLQLQTQAQSYKITVHTPNFKSGKAYLAYYWGKDLLPEDSANVNARGNIVFTAQKRLPSGIYSIVFPGKSRALDFLVDTEQVFSVKTDTTDVLMKTVITGSPANQTFLRYQRYIASKGKELSEEKEAYAKATSKEDSALHETRYSKLFKELEHYRDSIIQRQPKSVMAVLFRGMKEQKPLIAQPVTHEDSLNNYNYYKAHYWDGITFMDEAIIRTPFFLPKLERYYRQVLVQNADSIINEADYELLLARSCPEMYKFLLNWLTDEYYNPKYMGEDAVFVHLYNNYHSKGLSPWLSQKQQDAISKRAWMVMSNLIGDKAANLQMLDTANQPVDLYNVDADYTLVCFWDPNCGHCQQEVPRIDSIYRANWEKHNMKIFAVLTEDHVPEWKKYIREHHLNGWVHAYQTKEMQDSEYAAQKPNFKQLYDVTVTPTLYLLDKEKHIIAKKLSFEQIDDFLEQTKWNKKTGAN